jgi:hypothetical protein
MSDKTRPSLDEQAKRLRRSTAELLGFGSDFDKLSPADRVLVDRAATLRLRVDDLRLMQLKGEAIDTDEFVKASEQLEHVLRADRRVDAMGSPVALEQARDALRRVLGISRKQPAADAPSEADQLAALQERNKALEREVCELRKAKPIEPSAEPVVQPASEPQPEPPAPANTESPWREPTQYHSTKTSDGKPPPHYLKSGQPREPWESYVNGGRGGAIVAPYFGVDPITGQSKGNDK